MREDAAGADSRYPPYRPSTTVPLKREYFCTDIVIAAGPTLYYFQILMQVGRFCLLRDRQPESFRGEPA